MSIEAIRKRLYAAENTPLSMLSPGDRVSILNDALTLLAEVDRYAGSLREIADIVEGCLVDDSHKVTDSSRRLAREVLLRKEPEPPRCAYRRDNGTPCDRPERVHGCFSGITGHRFLAPKELSDAAS